MGSLRSAGPMRALRVHMELHETGMLADVYSGVYSDWGRSLFASLLGDVENAEKLSDMPSEVYAVRIRSYASMCC